jgi:hypothetical protein
MEVPCDICGELVTLSGFQANWNHPHYRKLHPEYVKWSKRWAMTLIVGYLSVLGIAILFAIGRFYGSIATVVILFSAVGFWSVFPWVWVHGWKNKVEKLRIDWQQSGQQTTPVICFSGYDIG